MSIKQNIAVAILMVAGIVTTSFASSEANSSDCSDVHSVSRVNPTELS